MRHLEVGVTRKLARSDHPRTSLLTMVDRCDGVMVSMLDFR